VKSDGAARGKLFAGSDIITEILHPGTRRPVKSVADVQQVIDDLKPGDYVGLQVMRVAGGSSASLTVTLRVPTE
jgi:S1-C subfamily serine protease